MLKNTPNISKSAVLLYLCIFTNGIASFLYHWYALYIFKLLDEFSMIIPMWLGLSKILLKLNYPIECIGIITIYNMLLLVLDVFPWFDPYFPPSFAVELLLLIPVYYNSLKYNNDLNHDGIKGILICSGSGIIWAITEMYCTKYFIFGHVIWHIGISTGLCYIITYFNNLPYNYKSI
tara:strand:- start:1311 stop:1841 length:531 start_codon:yes stop_codon:yes gene_type:complete